MSNLSNLKGFVSLAMDCTRFRLVRDEADTENEDLTFKPEMAHQIFGESESIFGYRDLRIDVMASAGPLDLFFDISYSKKVDELHNEGLKADDVEKSLASIVEDGCYYTSLDEFKRVLASKGDSFKPLGTKVDEFQYPIGASGTSAGGSSRSGQPRTFEVYVSSATDTEYMKFHSRLETFSFWFIDGFSRVELDPFWQFFTVYERYETDNNNGSAAEPRYATVGYLAAYKYYSYPNKVRPRISQILVLPPFQKLGIATRLIEHTTYEYFSKLENVADITYEEPIEAIQHIRSVIDARRCKALPAFTKDKLLTGLSKEMLQQAREHHLINAKQCRVVYEILRLGATDLDDEEQYRAYRIEVKKRLNMNYSKHRRDLARAKKRGVDVTAALCGLPSVAERIESLNAEYKEVEEIYGLVLQKLLASA
ncbi:histone acetyltransferase type B catalytic subunit [Anopheles ziemanni]|uniref:histone acetyltransferase type B catalytic subunit n=1 Tax=Anopheles coustani TaxID=139045 RepID=UPI002658CECA|nr:histone acetyltransferase type B catalytic subunit [Anopheles coustani]XP_058171841.1 histone acetyltransferase type B catalytic subunit [Anopheles ziemanni]